MKNEVEHHMMNTPLGAGGNLHINTVYGEELAKWEGSKAARPFSVVWDDPESGADLKVAYRTPKLEGAIMLAIGLPALAFASFGFRLCLQGAEASAWVGFGLILAFGVGVTVGALRTGWTRMEYEFKQGICTVRYSLAGLLRRKWSFAYDDKTKHFCYMRPMSDQFTTVPEYGFRDDEGNILFLTRQAMKFPHYDYFSLVVTAYLARNEDEEISKQTIASMRLWRNLRKSPGSKAVWIVIVLIILLGILLGLLDVRRKTTSDTPRNNPCDSYRQD